MYLTFTLNMGKLCYKYPNDFCPEFPEKAGSKILQVISRHKRKPEDFLTDLTYLVYLDSCAAKRYSDSYNRLHTLTIHLKTVTK